MAYRSRTERVVDKNQFQVGYGGRSDSCDYILIYIDSYSVTTYKYIQDINDVKTFSLLQIRRVLQRSSRRFLENKPISSISNPRNSPRCTTLRTNRMSRFSQSLRRPHTRLYIRSLFRYQRKRIHYQSWGLTSSR